MKSMESEILKEVREYITKLLQEKTSANYFYHTLIHTQQVVESVKEISSEENITENELEIVLIAAWFHDIGYVVKIKGHEEISAMFASEFLIQKKYNQEKIDSVISCILATKIPHNPTSQLQKIICDADLHHFGKDYFFERNDLYKKELEATQNKKINDSEFITNTIIFMNEHKYFTNYALKNYQPIKEKNISILKEQLKNLKK